MPYRLTRRSVLGVLGLTALGLTACGDSEEEYSTDLSENRVGAMDDYDVGVQFTATEPLTFSTLYLNHPSYQLNEDWMFWSELSKRTNISLERVAVPLSDYEQKRSLLIGAGDAPFIIPKTYPGQETAFVSSGAILPVSDYIDLMPNLQDKIEKWELEPDIDTLRQADGKFYLLPGVHEELWIDYSFAVRTDIMAELGLETPETLDDFYQVLKAMRAAYPDVYPLSDRWNQPTNGGCLLNIIGQAFGAPGGWGYVPSTWNVDEKRFEFTGGMDEFKDMVTYLNKLVEEKLIDPESFTQSDDVARQKFANSQSFVMTTNAQKLVDDLRSDLAGTNPNATVVKIPVPTGPMGKTLRSTRLENGVMISRKARESENFVAMIQFIDWLWYSAEGQEFAKWGVEGVTYTKDGSGKITPTADVDYVGLNPGASTHLQKDYGFSNGVFAYGGTTELLQSTFSQEELAFQEAMADWSLVVAPPAPLTDEEREQATLWETPLKDHVTQMSLEFILGQRDLSEWDDYLSELEGKNMAQHVDMINEAYERYQEDYG